MFQVPPTPGLRKADPNFIPHQSELEMHLTAKRHEELKHCSRSPENVDVYFSTWNRNRSKRIVFHHRVSVHAEVTCLRRRRWRTASQELSDVSLRSMGIAELIAAAIAANKSKLIADDRTDPVCGNRLLLGTRQPAVKLRNRVIARRSEDS